jgi:hypothetical protein
VFTVVGCFIFISITLLCALHFMDLKSEEEWRKTTAKVYAVFDSRYGDGDTETDREADNDVQFQSTSLTAKQNPKRSNAPIQRNIDGEGEIGEMEIVDSTLPAIVMVKNLSSKILYEQHKHHKWINIWQRTKAYYSRTLRLLSNLTNISIMLFIDALLYVLTFPEDDSCGEYTTEDDCLVEESSYRAGETKCAWVDTTEGTECVFVAPESTITVIVFIFIIASLCSVPLVKTQETLIQRVLSLPVTPDEAIDTGTNQPLQDEEAGADIPSIEDATVSNATKMKPVNSKESIQIDVLEKFAVLEQQLKEYSTSLSGKEKEKAQFDELWGLDTNGKFSKKELGEAFSVGSTLSWRRVKAELWRLSSSDEKKPAIDKEAMTEGEKALKRELASVSNRVRTEVSFFKENKVTDEDISKRLLFLLQCDLLPGQQGAILHRTKNNNDYKQRLGTASRLSHILGWTFQIGLNLFCMLYVLLFAINTSEERQRGWFFSFLIWLACDILVTSTIVVLVRQVLLPSVIIPDLDQIKKNLVKEMRAMGVHENSVAVVPQSTPPVAAAREECAIETEGIQSERGEFSSVSDGYISDDEDHLDIDHSLPMLKPPAVTPHITFNAADSLFVSSNLARLYPHLTQSRFVMRYSTPFPRHAYRPIHQIGAVDEMNRDDVVSISLVLRALVIFIVLVLMYIPKKPLEGVVETIVSVIFGFIILAVHQLGSPAYAALFIGIVFVTVFVFYHYSNGISKKREAHLSTILRSLSFKAS